MTIEINWEKVAESLVDPIINGKDFQLFCDNLSNGIEDDLRQALREKFIDPLAEQFKPDEDSVMEFVQSLEGDLSRAFFKRFVTDYLGRKW